MLNIEQTLGDRYPKVFDGPPKALTRPFIAFLRVVLHEREINRFLEELRDLQGLSFFERVLEHFSFGYRASNRDRENIPATGRVVIVANHPLGALDALTLIQLVAEVRRDIKVIAKRHLYRIGKGRSGIFVTERAIAHPQSRQLLKAEFKQARDLGRTRDDKVIYLFDYAPDSAVMKEIGGLRELSFRKVGEGSGCRLDLDRFDRIYRHLVLWDNDTLEIVGAYRIGETDRILARTGVDGLYTHTLFDLSEGFADRAKNTLELGRSFVQPAYWGSRALDYLW